MDVVVTVPKRLWAKWLAEGDAAGEPATSMEYAYWTGNRPEISKGERVYVVAFGKLRGYAPLVRINRGEYTGFPGKCGLVRGGGAMAVTIPEPIPGFRGVRYRWWAREIEMPFLEWRTP